MPERLGRDVNHFAAKLAGDHGVEHVRIGGELHLTTDQRHGANLAARNEYVDIQAFLPEITALLGEIGMHKAGTDTGNTDSDFSVLRFGVAAKTKQGDENEQTH